MQWVLDVLASVAATAVTVGTGALVRDVRQLLKWLRAQGELVERIDVAGARMLVATRELKSSAQAFEHAAAELHRVAAAQSPPAHPTDPHPRRRT